MKRSRAIVWAYTATIVLVTFLAADSYGRWNQYVGAQQERAERRVIQERAERRVIADSLLMVELLQHTDSIVAAVALQTSYRFLYERDSLIRAKRAECGPLRVC